MAPGNSWAWAYMHMGRHAWARGHAWAHGHMLAWALHGLRGLRWHEIYSFAPVKRYTSE